MIAALLCANIAIKKWKKFLHGFQILRRLAITKDKKGKVQRGDPKILDTSVII